jgi:hypothetical protein
MHRYATLLLCCALLAVATVVAAPAPFAKPNRQTGPWFDGWNKPVDPLGDCCFDRKGDRLTITVPAEDHLLEVGCGRLVAPRLLRDAEGDFVVQVRVNGNFWGGRAAVGYRRAGIIVMAGKDDPVLRVQVQLWSEGAADEAKDWTIGSDVFCPRSKMGIATANGLTPKDTPVYLRLERRGDVWQAYRRSGGEWARFFDAELQTRLQEWRKWPARLKVGVVAEADTKGSYEKWLQDWCFRAQRPHVRVVGKVTAEGSFKAVFSQFKLTPLASKTR